VGVKIHLEPFCTVLAAQVGVVVALLAIPAAVAVQVVLAVLVLPLHITVCLLRPVVHIQLLLEAPEGKLLFLGMHNNEQS
jgi:hypothetical protein